MAAAATEHTPLLGREAGEGTVAGMDGGTADARRKSYCDKLVNWYSGLSEKGKDNVFIIAAEAPIISSEVGYGALVAVAGVEAFTLPLEAAGVVLPMEVKILFLGLAYFFAANDSIISSLPIVDPRAQRASLHDLKEAYFPSSRGVRTVSGALDGAAKANPEYNKIAAWAGAITCLLAYATGGAPSPLVGLVGLFGRADWTLGLGAFWASQQFLLYILVGGKTPLKFAELVAKLQAPGGGKVLAGLFTKDQIWPWVAAIVGSVARAFVFSYGARGFLPACSDRFSPTDTVSEALAWTSFISAFGMNMINIGLYPMLQVIEKHGREVTTSGASGAIVPIATAPTASTHSRGCNRLIAMIAMLAYLSRAWNMNTFVNTLFKGEVTHDNYSFVLGGIGVVLGLIAFSIWRVFITDHSIDAVHGVASRSSCGRGAYTVPVDEGGAIPNGGTSVLSDSAAGTGGVQTGQHTTAISGMGMGGAPKGEVPSLVSP